MSKELSEIKELIGTINKTLPSVVAERERLNNKAKVLFDLEEALLELDGKLREKMGLLLEANNGTKNRNKQI